LQLGTSTTIFVKIWDLNFGLKRARSLVFRSLLVEVDSLLVVAIQLILDDMLHSLSL